jgi:hypothetical protein
VLLLMIVFGAIQGVAANMPQVLASVVVEVVIFAPLIALIVLLIRATRAAPHIRAAMTQYRAQMWQMHQTYQAPGVTQYPAGLAGYPQQLPPPPPPGT